MVRDVLGRPKKTGVVTGNGSTEEDRKDAHKKSASRCHPLTLDVHLILSSLAELLFVVFDQPLFALWFDHLLFEHLLFDATEQGCAKVFAYDMIPFELSDMRQCEGALPRSTTRFPSSAAYAAC